MIFYSSILLGVGFNWLHPISTTHPKLSVSQSYCFGSLILTFLYYLCIAIINKGYDERETAYSDHK